MVDTSKGIICYRGPSELDGSPIVMIATGFKGASNEKTGAGLIQTYILIDDMLPAAASQTGKDAGICGDCTHRGQYDAQGARIAGGRTCYVNLGQGPTSVAKAVSRGTYPMAREDELTEAFSGRAVRLGTYGDPAAVPAAIWRAILAQSSARTGYTHQWKQARFSWLAEYVMASVDSIDEKRMANNYGWRTFRVAEATGWIRTPGEGLCPASLEAGKSTTCDKCFLCSGIAGKGRANIMIPRHDTGARMAKKVTMKRNGIAA